MKYLLRILIVGIFFVLVFIPRSVIGVLNYWLLFLVLFIIVFLYLKLVYYLSNKSVSAVINDEFDFSIYCEKVPSDSEGDFIRGRLVIYNSMVLLYTKEKGKAKLTWSKPIDEIESIDFGKTSNNRKGFTLLCDNNKHEFVVPFKKIDEDKFIEALGFER
ncbi:MAG: hypothetical protein ACPKNR_00195 [Pleomorphochaeta sp.]